MFRCSRLRQQFGLFAWFAVATATLLISAVGIALCQEKAETVDLSKPYLVSHPPDQGKSPVPIDFLQKELHLGPSFAESLRKEDQGTKITDHFRAAPHTQGMTAPRTLQGLRPETQGYFLRRGSDPTYKILEPVRKDGNTEFSALGVHTTNDVLDLNTTNGKSELSGNTLWPIDVTKENLRRGSLVVIRGEEPTPAVKALLDDNKDLVWVRSSARSPNQDPRSIAHVVDRLEKPLKTEKLKIFDGLPNAYASFESFREFSEMDLPKLEFLKWGELGKEVQAKVDEHRFNSEPATKSGILKELSEGTSDVLVIVAHNDRGIMRFQPQARTGNVLGIEQANEETLSMSDLAAISRDTVPKRTILLISCEAGSVNADSASFAETLLRNKLADAVISSPEPVNAGDLPKILDDIAAQRTPLIRLFRPYPYHYTPIVFRMPSIKKYADG